MTHIDEVINVFFSAPNTLDTFDRKIAFENTCRRVEIAKALKINIIHWESSVSSGLGLHSGQDVIDKAIEGQYEVYVGCLGAKYGKGTIHEYERAVNGYLNYHRPQHVIFGFDETPLNPFEIDLKDLREVRRFRSEITNNKKYGMAMLYFTFSSESAFQEHIFRNLCYVFDTILKRVSGGIKIP